MTKGNRIKIIRPKWPAPTNVYCGSTLRENGFSLPPYNSLNIADHVGDKSVLVKKNRSYLSKQESIDNKQPECKWFWLEQIHGNQLINLDRENDRNEGDACITSSKYQCCAVMTADCLPILICDSHGKRVGAIHAGWRGLLSGVIENTLFEFSKKENQIQIDAQNIYAWLGPAIGKEKFEVGEEIVDQFVQKNSENLNSFKRSNKETFFADIYELAKNTLRKLGVNHIYGGDFCTFSDESKFYSYRRDKICGRMASYIYIGS